MPYCKPGDKPTIKYNFAGSPDKLYKPNLAPIEVVVRDTPLEASENYRAEGYGIRVWATDSNRFFDLVLRDHEIFRSPHTGEFVFTAMGCNESSFPLAYSNPQDCIAAKVDYRKCRQGFTINPSRGITITESIKCPVALKKECNISILYNGAAIFKDKGDCPCKFEVSCGNCPPNHIECKTNTYPGYCCIPCEEIKTEIAGAKAILKRINNG